MRADLDIHEKSQRAFVSVVRAYKGTPFASFTRTKVQILTPEELQRGARLQRTPVHLYFSDGEAVAWRPRLRFAPRRLPSLASPSLLSASPALPLSLSASLPFSLSLSLALSGSLSLSWGSCGLSGSVDSQRGEVHSERGPLEPHLCRPARERLSQRLSQRRALSRGIQTDRLSSHMSVSPHVCLATLMCDMCSLGMFVYLCVCLLASCVHTCVCPCC